MNRMEELGGLPLPRWPSTSVHLGKMDLRPNGLKRVEVLRSYPSSRWRATLAGWTRYAAPGTRVRMVCRRGPHTESVCRNQWVCNSSFLGPLVFSILTASQ